MKVYFDCCFLLDLICIILVLVRFTSNLHFLHQHSTMNKSDCKSSSFSAKSTISSAYRRILMSSPSSNITPILEFLISIAKSFMNIANNVGLRQSPCLTPTGQSKYSVSCSFNITLDLGLEYKEEIALYMFPLMPTWDNL